MRVRSRSAVPDALEPDLVRALADARGRRGFDARAHVDAKTGRLNDYLAAHGRTACVVAVSGGVDSAVALGLVARAAGRAGSPIRRIVALLLPITGPGATGQESATDRGRRVCAEFGVDPTVVDLTAAREAMKDAMDAGVGAAGDDWAAGQLVSYLRTPAIYYATSLLTQLGLGPVVIGTTNRDEGAYLGFFGKASDAMVDVQLIADLHKSEVYAVAGELGVPSCAIEAAPSGDMFDGRTDEEVFGAPYDFVELFLAHRCLDPGAAAAAAETWSRPAREQFAELSARLEELHRHNAHKYLARSPAVHLDVLDSAVPGGWGFGTWPV